MASRRSTIHDFYKRPAGQRPFHVVEKAASSADRFAFKGAQLTYAVVVRTDLNGYSTWARDKQVADRARLLDDFFTRVVPEAETSGGVVFRDEGDCIITLFTNYFNAVASFDSAEAFAMRVTAGEYGVAKLTAKSTISCGNVAIYQKAHEQRTQDWSAEGDPFVRAARLEQAITSKRQIVTYVSDYDAHFKNTSNYGQLGSKPKWSIRRDKLQVPGLALLGGWTDVVYYDYNA